jgi:hypothetical protein
VYTQYFLLSQLFCGYKQKRGRTVCFHLICVTPPNLVNPHMHDLVADLARAGKSKAKWKKLFDSDSRDHILHNYPLWGHLEKITTW